MSRTIRLFRTAAIAALAAGGPVLAQDPQAVTPAQAAVPCPPVVECVPPAATGPAPTAPAAPYTASPPTAAPYASPAVGGGAAGGGTTSFGGTLAGAGPGATTAVNPGGYIDGAVPINTVRLRYDSAYQNNRPDRAEFFYPKCGCFATLSPQQGGPQLNAKGPPLPEKNVDYQDVSTYLEARLAPQLSVFGEIPVRFINPEVNANAAGLSDVNFGFKYAAVLTDTRILTFQLRTIAPSGNGRLGLGTDNWWVEPGILWQAQPADRLIFFGELRDTIPVSPASDFTGNVLQHGIGSAYILYASPRFRVLPVGEVVGWTVLSGKEFSPDTGVTSARGDTIVNAKVGTRLGFGEVEAPGALGRHNIYIGYGRALTGEVWYKNMLRLEYRLLF